MAPSSRFSSAVGSLSFRASRSLSDMVYSWIVGYSHHTATRIVAAIKMILQVVPFIRSSNFGFRVSDVGCRKPPLQRVHSAFRIPHSAMYLPSQQMQHIPHRPLHSRQHSPGHDGVADV